MENIQTDEWEECRRLHNDLKDEILENDWYFSEERTPRKYYIDKINSLFEELYSKNKDVYYDWPHCPLKDFKLNFQDEYKKVRLTDESMPYFFYNQLFILFQNTDRVDRKIHTTGNLAECKSFNEEEIWDNNESYVFLIGNLERESKIVSCHFDGFNQKNKNCLQITQNDKIKYILVLLYEPKM